MIGNGVDFNTLHFDCAFFFCNDRSTCARQAFQQLNRVRTLRLNTVHMHVSVRSATDLPTTYESVHRDVQQRVATMQRDYITQRAANGKFSRLDLQWDMIGYEKILRNSGFNAIFVRNQLEVNISRSNFLVPLYTNITDAGGAIMQVDVIERASVQVMHKTAAKELTEQQMQAVMNARDIMSDAELDDTRQRVNSMSTSHQVRQPGDDEALQKAEIKLLYRLPLTDTTTLPSISNFMQHYGTQQRQDQCRNMSYASTGGAARMTRDAENELRQEYAEHVTEKIQVHHVVETLLLALGFTAPASPQPVQADVGATASSISWTHPDLAVTSSSVIWSNDSVCSQDAIARLDTEPNLRTNMLTIFQHPLLRKWWNDRQKVAKEKNLWTMSSDQAYDLTLGDDKDGQAPMQKGKLLHHEMMVGVRLLLRNYFGVKLEKRRNRRNEFDLNRRHWDEWAARTFAQWPQNPDPAHWASERDKEDKKDKTEPAAVAAAMAQ